MRMAKAEKYRPGHEPNMLHLDATASNKKRTEIAETIMLVDDEDQLLKIFSKALENFGYKVLTAGNGKEAFDLYRAQKDNIDLVIMDLCMPVLSGYQAIEEILWFDPMAKVIIASGHLKNDKVMKALESGVMGYIAKPFRLANFLNMIRNVLDG